MSPPSKSLVAALFIARLCLTVVAQDATPASAPAFKLATTRHEVEGLGHYFRAVATVGTNQFAFIVPKGYLMRLDEANRQLRAVEQDDKCAITVRLIGTPTNAVDKAGGDLKAEVFRELVLQRFPSAKITEEITLSAAGRSGPAFDLTWKNESGLGLQSRIAFISSPAGIIEFHLLTSGTEMQEFRYALNSLMLTLRFSENGRLELPELSNKL
ncbi:MAG: hypothetical protein WCS99_01515 [Limisphaerales bacterium]